MTDDGEPRRQQVAALLEVLDERFVVCRSLSRLKGRLANGDSKEVSEWWIGAEARGQYTSDGGRGEWPVQMEE